MWISRDEKQPFSRRGQGGGNHRENLSIRSPDLTFQNKSMSCRSEGAGNYQLLKLAGNGIVAGGVSVERCSEPRHRG